MLQSDDPEDREYPADADQIREVLIHGNYLSQKDIDTELHEALITGYGAGE